jgi:hypothetical protein
VKITRFAASLYPPFPKKKRKELKKGHVTAILTYRDDPVLICCIGNVMTVWQHYST